MRRNTSVHILKVAAPKIETGQLHNQQPLQPEDITGKIFRSTQVNVVIATNKNISVKDIIAEVGEKVKKKKRHHSPFT
jgi:hypothetical protein